MKSLKKKRRIQVIVIAALALGVSVALIGTAFKDSINLYRSPSEVVEKVPPADETFQLGGLIKEGSITPVEGVRFKFIVTDGGAEIPVSYVGTDPRPDLFSEGQGTIATGKYVGGEFFATKLLAKHDENYMPREVIDSLKEQGVYKAPES